MRCRRAIWTACCHRRLSMCWRNVGKPRSSPCILGDLRWCWSPATLLGLIVRGSKCLRIWGGPTKTSIGPPQEQGSILVLTGLKGAKCRHTSTRLLCDSILSRVHGAGVDSGRVAQIARRDCICPRSSVTPDVSLSLTKRSRHVSDSSA